MNFKEELMKLKNDLETKYVIFYSDGKVGEENSKRIEDTKPISDEYFYIKTEFKDAYERLTYRGYNIDSMNMTMILGVLYNASDVNEDHTLKEGAKPASELVHYYTGDLTTYDANGELNEETYCENRMRHQTFMKFSDLVSKTRKEGLNYEGPETFEELVNLVNTKQPCDINISVGLVDKKEEQITTKEIPEEAPKKRLRFFR